jgi:hypothetical protein
MRQPIGQKINQFSLSNNSQSVELQVVDPNLLCELGKTSI